MCGRSTLTKTEKEIEARFNASFYSDELERYNPLPNYNVAPTHYHPILTNQDLGYINLFKWGLIPSWAKDHKLGYKMINARIETLMEKSSFKKALEKRRCLVPMDGFYEWKKNGKEKQPYRIQTTDQEIFCCAGLWEKWISPSKEVWHTFTVITQGPNELMKNIHDRMPAILQKEQELLWLSDELSPKDLLELINPYPSEHMRAYPVSKKVGKVSENYPSLIEEEKLDVQGSLF